MKIKKPKTNWLKKFGIKRCNVILNPLLPASAACKVRCPIRRIEPTFNQLASLPSLPWMPKTKKQINLVRDTRDNQIQKVHDVSDVADVLVAANGPHVSIIPNDSAAFVNTGAIDNNQADPMCCDAINKLKFFNEVVERSQ